MYAKPYFIKSTSVFYSVFVQSFFLNMFSKNTVVFIDSHVDSKKINQ